MKEVTLRYLKAKTELKTAEFLLKKEINRLVGRPPIAVNLLNVSYEEGEYYLIQYYDNRSFIKVYKDINECYIKKVDRYSGGNEEGIDIPYTDAIGKPTLMLLIDLLF